MRIALAGPDVAASAEIAQGTKTVQERAFRLKLADGVMYAERGGKHLFLQPDVTRLDSGESEWRHSIVAV